MSSTLSAPDASSTNINGDNTSPDTSGSDSSDGSDASSDPAASCQQGSTYNGSLGLRVGAIFIILVTSIFGTLFPIVARRYRRLNVPMPVFDFAKYFGSGVIIATAFIHLLSPAFEELGSPCLQGTWQLYPWPAAIAMAAVFGIFIVEFFALRIGMAKLEALGIEIDHPNAQKHTAHEHRPIADAQEAAMMDEQSRMESGASADNAKVDLLAEKGQPIEDADAMEAVSATQHPAAQILGVAILEFGVIFHSITIGLTLAVTDDFVTLFIVIIFHQMFEGLGLGSRLAYLPLPLRLNYVPFLAGTIYAFVTPLGLAIGLGVRTTYNDNSVTANIVQGVLDSISAGILLYTGLVELLAHEFLFHDGMRKASNAKVCYALGCVVIGCGIMALLGRWA